MFLKVITTIMIAMMYIAAILSESMCGWKYVFWWSMIYTTISIAGVFYIWRYV